MVSIDIVVWLLPVSWAIHDLEEVPMVEPWMDANRATLQQFADQFGPVDRVLSVMAETTSEFTLSASLVGLVMVGASLAATVGGRPGLLAFAVVLGGYALHAGTHVGQAIVFRGYTPGVLTAVIVVVPSSGFIYWRLFEAGVLTPPVGALTAVAGIALFPPVGFFAHLLSGRIAASVWGVDSN